MKAAYPTILTRDKDIVLVEVPDLGILTEGKSVADAIYMARDAIGLAGVTLQDKKQDVPKPSALEDIDIASGTFADVGGGILTLVDIDFDAYRRKLDRKMVRRNVTLPEWLNEAADEANLNVSGVLQEALKDKLGFAKEA